MTTLQLDIKDQSYKIESLDNSLLMGTRDKFQEAEEELGNKKKVLQYTDSAHEQVLSKLLISDIFTEKNLTDFACGEQIEEQDHNFPDISLDRTNIYLDKDQYLPCNAQILDSYPKILKDESDFSAVPQNKNDSQTYMMSNMKEQYLYLSNIQLVISDEFNLNIQICFPEGYYVDIDFNRSKLQQLCGRYQLGFNNRGETYQFKLMHFIITQSSGEKKYLTSLQYNKTMHRAKVSLHSLKTATFLYLKVYYFCSSLKRQMLEFIYEDIILKYHKLFNEEYQDADDFSIIEQKLSKARQQTKIERLEFYLSTFFHHLKIDGSNLEIEIYKKSSSLNDTLSPQSPSSDGQYKQTIIRYINTFNKECLRLENYDFKLLFQKVRPKMLMQMFVSLLHERKIILIHNEGSKNAILIETLISLLYPLQWNFTNISYMIPSMVEYLEAPFPYIVGVPRELWKHIYEQKWDILGEEVVAFDIDNNKVYEKEELPDFPQPYTQLLIKQLEIQLDKSKQMSNRGGQNQSFEMQREEERFWNNFTLKVKQQFLNFLIFLINTFENFYVKKGESPNHNHANQTIGNRTADSTLDSSRQPNANAFSNNGSANDIFNFDEYVQNVRENQSFFEKFVRTQAFINFIEQAYYEEQGNLSDASIRFFKECTRKLSKENLQSVRAMQDNMISGLMHKFNDRNISYSISKCYLIYEKSLKIEAAHDKYNSKNKSNFGLIQQLNHNKIIKMTSFDPTQLIQKRFSKGQDSMYEFHRDKAQMNKNKSKQNQDFISDINTLGPPNNNHQQKFNQLQLAEYFTVQATPQNNGTKINLQMESELSKSNLCMTAQHIKIEDDGQISEDSKIINPDKLIEEESNENSSEEKDGTGLLGFFKKTFSSVKKTFESTFNPNQVKSKSQTRPAALSSHSVGRQALMTPNPLVQEKHQDDSPEINKKNNQSRVQNRAARSQTFHVQQSINPSEKDQPKRDRKNNNSFLANLWNLGSSKKNQMPPENLSQRQVSVSPKKLLHEEKKALFKNERNRTLNGSGFFIFNEEDMKSMTEMSPQNLNKKSITTTHIEKAQIKFDYKQVEGQLSQRQQPRVKGMQIQDTYLINRMRSISYQNNLRQISSNHNSGQKTVKLLDKNDSNNNSQIIQEQQLNYKTSVDLGFNRQTFAANSQSFSPLEAPNETRNALESQDDNSTNQIVFNLNNISTKDFRSFRHTPILSNQLSGKKDSKEVKNEFEEIYKKSTENLFYVPPSRTLDISQKERNNIWKSQTSKLNLKNAASKPPKHQHQLVKKNNGVQQTKFNKIMSSTPNNNPSKPANKDDKLILQRSQNSELYNDRNSTDEDMKPIYGKNLNQFENIMQSKHFEKQNIINQHSSSNSIKRAGSNHNSNNASNLLSNFNANPNFSMNQISKTLSRFQQSHKRQISSGMQNVFVKGETNIPLSSPVLENIEPDEDNKVKQNKQIESLQIGRARKKSNYKGTYKSGASNLQSRKASNNISALNSYSQGQSSINNNHKAYLPGIPQNKPGVSSRPNYQKYPSKMTVTRMNPKKSNNNVAQNPAAKKGGQFNQLRASQMRDDNAENEQANIMNQSKLNYSHVQAKTVQSSSYSSYHSQLESLHNESMININNSKIEIQKHNRAEDSKVGQPNSQIHLNHEQLDHSNIHDDSYVSQNSQSEGCNNHNSSSYINVINQSIDFRDSKKGDFFRLRSQAAVVSPTNNVGKTSMTQNLALVSQHMSDAKAKDFSNELKSNYQSFGKVQSMVQGVNMGYTSKQVIMKENEEENEDLSNLGIVIHEQNDQRQELNKKDNVKKTNGRVHSLSQHQNYLGLKIDKINSSPITKANQNKFTSEVSMFNLNINKYLPNQECKTQANQSQKSLLSLNQNITNFHNSKKQNPPIGNSRYEKQDLSGNISINLSNNNEKQKGHQMRGPPMQQARQNMKPLNKITWDAFNQIAKLSGDVDHEPHTPQSAGVGNMSDCEDTD